MVITSSWPRSPVRQNSFEPHQTFRNGWLSEAFHKNSEPKSFHKSVPTHFHDLEDLFAKLWFDCLPDRKVWDHAIELVPDAKVSSCKVYPLAPNE
jgi:hypothetical protein